MKIARIQLYPIVIPRQTGVTNQHIIVRLETDDGHTGWGEMSDLSHLPLFQMDIPNLQQSLNDLLRGKDPRSIALIEQEMDRYYPVEGHKTPLHFR
jgi:muconate cycloisomerase